MQTLEQFIESIDVPKILLPDFLRIEQKLVNMDDQSYGIYMCFMGVSHDFIGWMLELIDQSVPRVLDSFVAHRGITALFYHKEWMMIAGLPTGEVMLSTDEYIVSNKLRLDFVRLAIAKIKRTQNV
jgi:hypothetical protein